MRTRIVRPALLAGAFCLLSFAAVQAGTIQVTTNKDEDLGAGGAGCSLREAMQLHFNNDGNPYKGCTVSGFSAGAADTITFSGNFTITVNAAADGAHGVLPHVTATAGPITVDGVGHTVAIGCTASKMFIVQSNGSLNLSNLAIADCTASGAGVAITNTGGSLSANQVSFTNIHSDSGGNGPALNQSGGSLSLANVNFTSNGTGDSNSGTEVGDGGAVALANVATVSMLNVTFTNNSAENNGGALFLDNGALDPYVVQLTNVAFTANTAGGSGAQEGGGAIWALMNSNVTDVFLITSGQFNLNEATNGAGGAILLALGSRLAYALPEIPNAGGIFACNFTNNTAGGPAGADGSGGAIFARGALTVVQSSFLSNTSTNGSGGALALNAGASSETVLANVTFHGNTADQNGGAVANLHSAGRVRLINDTLSGNTANGADGTAGGGAIFNANSTATDFSVRNTILASSAGVGGNCAGSAVSNAGNNLQFSPNTGCGGMTAGDPQLNAPSISPGPNLLVLTMSIDGDHSPAQGGGDQPTCAAGPILNFDATGRIAIRPLGDPACDIGAYESSTTFPVELLSFEVE